MKKKAPVILNIILFLFTFLTCMIAGTMWAYKDFTEITNWHYGLTYAFLIMGFLTSHEFGHYFAARKHGVDATLPYYIPLPIPFFINFGTLGAVIKTRSPVPNRKALFDIGASGPIAGFIFCIIILIYGFQTLPPIDFIYDIHPEYLTQYGGKIPETSLFFGDTALFSAMKALFANPEGFVPPMNEIYHYPFLCVGWFGLFVTTLNMLPIGQLDGGHITYAMFGPRLHAKIARIAWWILLIIGVSALLEIFRLFLEPLEAASSFFILKEIFYPPLQWLKENVSFILEGWFGWLFWAFITRVFIKLDHPPIIDYGGLGKRRRIVGWVTLIILLLSFSWNGIFIIE